MTESPSPVITRIEPLRPKGLRVALHLVDEEPLEVTLEALERSRLGVGDALTSQKRHHLLSADADVRVRDAALTLLSFRARTRQELARRLRQKGFGAERISPCLDRLAERGLLDDGAVAAAFVRDRLRHRPKGKATLVSELRAKGVEPDVARETIERVFEDEGATDEALARDAVLAWLARQGPDAVAALRGSSASPEREKARRRLYGYLARRGFRGEALRNALEQVVDHG